MHDLLDGLTEGLTDAQRQAVTHTEGPVLVLAGPGSGKTTVVTRRVAHLVAVGIPAWQILALTFTNKAAGEMRERIEHRLPADVPGRRGLTVSTFHAFAARLLRRYADAANVARGFSIYDSADQRAAIKQAIKTAELNERNFSPAAVASAISAAKNRLLDADGYAKEADDFFTRCIARAYSAYERILRTNDALDFDDLLLRTARLLRDVQPVRNELQARYQYLLVDEYQDTNHAQFVIASALAAEHRNLCVVGDPDQSIYGWRGADIKNILEFEQLYPEATIIPLGQNFRSTGHIVRAADQLIQRNQARKHKPLFTELGDGEKPRVVMCRDEHHEAQIVVDECRRRHDEDGVAWKDMAVLYRMNALSRVLEEVFRDAQMPYVIARGTAFYDRKEVKDALSYLRLIVNPNDEVALRRVVNTPARGIGKTTLDRVEMFALDRQLRFGDALRCAGEIDGIAGRTVAAIGRFVTMLDGWRAAAAMEAGATPLAELVGRVVRESGMEKLYARSVAEEDQERAENLEELINAAAQFHPARVEDSEPALDEAEAALESDAETTGGRPDAPPWTGLDWLAAYLETVALVSDADAIDPANGAVTLMTLHAAKGLEFDVVNIVGLEAGLLPHHRAAEQPREMEEERRLCFVGITRARRWLQLTSAALRTHRGIRERTIVSPFLDELPADDIVRSHQADYDAVDEWSDPSRGRAPRAGHAGGIAGDFPAGAIVRHPTFGLGRIETVTPRPAGSRARVLFEGIGEKTLILEYAKLERVG